MACLRIAYDGAKFSGSQRQPSKNTVEGEILKALSATDFIDEPDDLEVFMMASRTDKGVSARENLLNMRHTEKDIGKHNLLKRVNHVLDGVWITGISDKEYTRPMDKTYHYYLPDKSYDTSKLEALCNVLSGRHDFTNFSKYNPEKESVRSLEMGFFIRNEVLVLTFSGTGFLWQMCRRLTMASIEHLAGERSLDDIRSLLDGSNPSKVRPADSSNLVLFEIKCGLEFNDVEEGLEAMKRHYGGLWEDAVAKRGISEMMLGRL